VSERLAFIFGRALPLGVFGFLVAVQGELALDGLQKATLGELDRAAIMYLLNRFLTLFFFSFLLVIYVIRSKALAKDHNPAAIFFALIGSFVLYFLWLLPGQERSNNVWVLACSDIFLGCGMVFALYSLSYLRHRFSIVPEARGLVTTGPYRLVRHPIYLGEILAATGLILPTALSLHLAVYLLFIYAQVRRTYYEERVLRSIYPEYDEYAARTPRLIPFVMLTSLPASHAQTQ
jgi:protein-S-isoprenylcysteine O-methyltransferase Ste14